MLDVLGDHPEAVEADLIRYYGYAHGPGGPLAAFWRGEMTLRLLRVLVEHLPPDSATARAQAGHHWTHRDYAAADTVDLLGLLVTQFANAHRDPKTPAAPMPEPGWRPGDPSPDEVEAAKHEKQTQARAAYDRITSQVLPERG
ncbi:hypothetical protein G5C65_07650 [Streptomyces sp. SB3404]|uniref:Uncharacterized protein n=1 Tax=Streptomyces boncukensis TaxID=2711219 RepID=A0A6G4WSZ4_9ACTN|nr:hypothetical protein [Streptomyces boncukensis]